jgi:hypothetical protein
LASITVPSAGRDDQDDNIGDLGAAGAHRGEGGVARRIDERDLVA